MLRTIIGLPDGTEISSGVGAVNAIQSCTVTECVNSGTELTLGSVCANMVELKLITPDGGLQITAGDEITVYKVTDDNARHQLGIFIAEKPTRPSAHTMKLTAYDRISKLDKDLTEWVTPLTGWPYALFDFATMVCTACGLELINTEIPNGNYLVQAFSAEGITGRQMMQWIGEAAGRFCRATPEGNVEFAWYESVEGHTIGTTATTGAGDLDFSFDEESGTLTLSDENMEVSEENGVVTVNIPKLTVTHAEDGTVTIQSKNEQHFFFQGGLSFEDYKVAPINKVQIQKTADDVGVIWPNDTEAVNTYRITGNLLLSDETVESLQPVAENLYEQLQAVTYTPCVVTIPATLDIRAGHIVSVTDRNGKTITAYVMTKKQTGQKDTIECTGNHSRDSVSAVNEQSYKALSGKVLNLRTDVDGIKAENIDAAGRLARLELTVDGLGSTVQQQSAEGENLSNRLTQLQQTAESLQLSVQTIKTQGADKVRTEAGYTFDADGLKISKEGEAMENRLDNTGMYVTRDGEEILGANHEGVSAINLTSRQFLIVGANSRFENYDNGTDSKRTACFYIGE